MLLVYCQCIVDVEILQLQAKFQTLMGLFTKALISWRSRLDKYTVYSIFAVQIFL